MTAGNLALSRRTGRAHGSINFQIARLGGGPLPFGTSEKDKSLKINFHRKLNQSRRRCAHDCAKRGIADIAVYGSRSVELRVIENIEGFESELERLRFIQTHGLGQGQVEVINAGTVEESSPGHAEIAQF